MTTCSFTQNKAVQGGVIFAIAKSKFSIDYSVMMNNYGFDASAIYGMANTDEKAL